VISAFTAHQLTERTELRLAAGLSIDRIPDLSLSGARERGRFARAAIRRLEAVQVEALSQEDYVTLLAVRVALGNIAEAALHATNDLSLVTPGGSPLRLLPSLFAGLPLETPADAERYVFLTGAVGFAVDSLRARLAAQRARGAVLSKRALSRAVPFVRSFAARDGSSPFALSPERLARLDTASARELRAEVDQAIRLRVAPAFDSLASYLSGSYAAGAPAEDGLWQSVGGKQYYRSLVRRFTSLDVTPEQVHEAGLQEVARLDSAMTALRRRMGGGASADAFRDSLARAAVRALSDSEVVARIEDVQTRPAAILDTARLSDSLQIGYAVAWDRARPAVDVVFGHYRPPSNADPIGRVTPGGALRAPAASLMIPAFSYFAVRPGRHELFGRRVEASAALARYYAEVPAFVDGWGLYALDGVRARRGFTSAAEEYGALALEMVAAARLVVDTGIHYFGWTREQATAFLRHATLLAADDIEAEVTRAAEDAPGAGLAAGMGVRELRGVRAWAQRELGSRFDAAAFDRELRSLGPVPLQVLGAELEWWIYQQKQRAG
jgi:uncharacterized protein (DUF885 family)